MDHLRSAVRSVAPIPGVLDVAGAARSDRADEAKFVRTDSIPARIHRVSANGALDTGNGEDNRGDREQQSDDEGKGHHDLLSRCTATLQRCRTPPRRAT